MRRRLFYLPRKGARACITAASQPRNSTTTGSPSSSAPFDVQLKLLRNKGLHRELLDAVEAWNGAEQPSKTTYQLGMEACMRLKDWKRALSLLEEAKGRLGDPVPMEVYNGALNALAKCGQNEEAMRLLRKMEAEGRKPDVYSYGCAMDGYSKAGDYQGALALLEKVS